MRGAGRSVIAKPIDSAAAAAVKAAEVRFREFSRVKGDEGGVPPKGYAADNTKAGWAKYGVSGKLAGTNRFHDVAPTVPSRTSVKGDTARVHAALAYLSVENPTPEHGHVLKNILEDSAVG